MLKMHCRFLLSLAFLLLSYAHFVNCKKDGSPGFFLKLAKNVPRIGRRSDKEYENYLMKNTKHIPRIGRGTENYLANNELMSWLNEVPQPSKRMMMHPAFATEREYSVVQPVNSNTLIELVEQDAIRNDNIKFVHWKDFDRALQQDSDLYAKVISLGRNPDLTLRNDLGLSNYAPLFGRAGDGGEDFKLYNGADNEMYPFIYDRDMLHYNSLKK